MINLPACPVGTPPAQAHRVREAARRRVAAAPAQRPPSQWQQQQQQWRTQRERGRAYHALPPSQEQQQQQRRQAQGEQSSTTPQGDGTSNSGRGGPPSRQRQAVRGPVLAAGVAGLSAVGASAYALLSSLPQLPPVGDVLGGLAVVLLLGGPGAFLAAKAVLGDGLHAEVHR